MADTFFDTVEKIFHDWHYDHPKVLYGLMRALKPAVAVEVGTYRGYGACYMARALQENNTGKLYCIDNFSLRDHTWRYGDPKKHLEKNLSDCGVRDFVTIVDGDSDKVRWPEKIDFAYVDGWHSFQACSDDVQRCWARGAQCICFDDVRNCVGPALFLAELRKSRPPEMDIMELGSDNGLGIIMRRPKPSHLTFSQELPNNPGVDITAMSAAEQKTYLQGISKTNKVCYDPLFADRK